MNQKPDELKKNNLKKEKWRSCKGRPRKKQIKFLSWTLKNDKDRCS